MNRPEASEYDPFYAGYIAAAPKGDILDALARQSVQVQALLDALDDAAARHRYAPGKWSIKELLGHLIDAERVFAYRALRFARGDETPLPGFDQDPYIEHAHFDRRSLGDLLEEHRLVRAANLRLFRTFDEEMLRRQGVASGSPVSVRALLYIIAGHEQHHLQVLRERYLPGVSGR